MAPPGGPDTQYLKESIGDALARGCAAVITAQPNDPVEYLALWLLRYVKNAEIEGQFVEEKGQALAAKKKALEANLAAVQAAANLDARKKAAIENLATASAEPRELLVMALKLVKEFTGAGAAYAAAVADTEEPDYTLNTDPDNPEPETEDEAEAEIIPPGIEGDEVAAEPPAEAEAEEAAGGGDDASGGAPKVTRPVDYSKKYFAYVAATAGQEWVEGMDLRRPPPPPEEAEEGAPPPPPLPFTFRMLDERIPLLAVPNVAFEPRIKFFKPFPKIGGYLTAGVQVPGSGEFKAIIAADTLVPTSGGQAFEQSETDFVWDVSLALGKALANAEKVVREKREGSSAAEVVNQLATSIHRIRHPQPVEPDELEASSLEGAPPAAAAAEAVAEPAEEEAPAPSPEDGGDDPIATLKVEVYRLAGEVKRVTAEAATAQASVALEQEVLSAIMKALHATSGAALFALRHSLSVPQATFHVLKAVLYLLGKEPSSCSTWKRCLPHLSLQLYTQLAAYDATQERDPVVWSRVRSAYKGVTDPKNLEKEFPDSFFGVMLLQHIKQVRRVGRRAAASRALEAELAQLYEQTVTIKQQLADAEQAKVEADAAAAAEAEAAAVAEETAEAGEEEAQEEEADE